MNLGHSIQKIFINKLPQELFDELIIITFHDNRILHPFLLRTLFELFFNTKYLSQLFDVLLKVSKNNNENYKLCHEAKFDFYLVSLLHTCKTNPNYCSKEVITILLNFIANISEVISSTSFVKAFLSLLKPICNEGKYYISELQPAFSETLYQIIANRYFRSVNSIYIGRTILSFSIPNITNVKEININFWIYVHKAQSKLMLFQLNFDDSFVKFFIDNSLAIFIDINNILYETKIILKNEIWHNLQFSISNNSISSSCNMVRFELLNIPVLLKTNEISVKFIEQEVSQSFVEISSFDVYKNIDINYEKETFFSNPILPSKSHDSLIFYNSTIIEAKEKFNSFSFCLLNLWYFDLLLPIFDICSTPFQSGEIWKESSNYAFGILLKALDYSKDLQEKFYYLNHIQEITGILYKYSNEFITYNLYLQFFSLFQTIQYQKLKEQIFDLILSNVSLWIICKNEDHLNILKHWYKTLFISFLPYSEKLCNFSKMLNYVNIYYMDNNEDNQVINEIKRDCDPNLDKTKCFQLIQKTLLFLADINFQMRDFYLLFYLIYKNKNNDTAQLFITILKNLICSIPNTFKSLDFSFKDISLFHLLLNSDCMIIVDIIEIIIYIYKYGILEMNLLSFHLNLILSKTNINDNQQFYQKVKKLLYINIPELINVAFFSAIKNDYKAQNDLITHLLNIKNIDCSNSLLWFLYPIILILLTDNNDIKNKVINFLIYQSGEKWVDIFNNLEVIGRSLIEDIQYMYQKVNDIKFSFLSHEYSELMKSKCISQNQLTTYWNITFKFIFFRSIDELTLGKEADSGNGAKKIEFDPLKIINNLKMNIDNKEKKKFGIRISNEDNTLYWMDSTLVHICLDILTNNPNLISEKYLFIILYFYSFFEPNHAEILSADFKLNSSFSTIIKNSILKRTSKIEYSAQMMESDVDILNSAIQIIFKKNSISDNVSDIKCFIKGFNDIENFKSDYEPIKDSALYTQKLSADIIYMVKNCFISWNKLWSELSFENGPWYLSNSSYYYKRDDSYNFCFCPFIVSRKNRIKSKKYVSPSLMFNANTIQKKYIVISEAKLIKIDRIIHCTFNLSNSQIDLRLETKKMIYIKLNEIDMIFIRNICHIQTGIEMFLFNGASYLIEFLKDDPKAIINHISIMNPKFHVKQHSFVNVFKESNHQKDWIEGNISNFKYLMYLNVYSGRTFHDLSQYPIFPWIIIDYKSKVLNLNDPNIYRKLGDPIGTMNQDHFKKLLELYDSPKNDNNNCLFNHGSVSPLSLCLYFLRIEPFTRAHLKLQDSSFDLPDRLISSMESCWEKAKYDFWELTPEFYYMPEFTQNLNNLDLRLNDNNLKLPDWCHNNPLEFVYLNRKVLESDYVSSHLNEWIDLTWGINQNSKNANNVYNSLLYEDVWNKSTEYSKEQLKSYLKIMGQIPPKLFYSKHPPKQVKNGNMKSNANININFEISSDVVFVKFALSTLSKLTIYFVEKKGFIDVANVDISNMTHTLTKLNYQLKDEVINIEPISDQKIAIIYSNKVEILNFQFPISCNKVNLKLGQNNNIATSKHWLAISSDGYITKIFSFPLMDFLFSYKIYSDNVTCSYISDIFKVHVNGTKNCTLIVSSLESKKMLHLIDLGNICPLKVLVSQSWGFIVCYGVNQSNENFLLVYSINGIFIRKHNLDSKIILWITWESKKGFDYLSYITETNSLFLCELFYLNPTRLGNLFGITPKCMYEVKKLGLIFIIDKNGKLSSYSFAYDDFENFMLN